MALVLLIYRDSENVSRAATLAEVTVSTVPNELLITLLCVFVCDSDVIEKLDKGLH